MSETTSHAPQETSGRGNASKVRLVAAGGVLSALAASSCCVIPLVLFSLGISGAWIGTLTALAPYKPIFIVITAGFLAYGYYLVYRQSQTECADEAACARPLPNHLVKAALWVATALVILAFAWPVIIPRLAPFIFGQ